MLECDFCGCYSPKPDKGWIAFHGNEDTVTDQPGVLIYCPKCATAVFGLRPDLAVGHVCVWKSPPSDTHDPSAEVA